MLGLITPSTFYRTLGCCLATAPAYFCLQLTVTWWTHHPTLPSYQEKQPLSSQDLDISLLSDDIMIAEIARQFFRDFPHLIGSSTLCRIRAWSFSFTPANRLARVRPSFRRYHHIRKCNIRIPRFYSLGRSRLNSPSTYKIFQRTKWRYRCKTFSIGDSFVPLWAAVFLLALRIDDAALLMQYKE